ncbi:hypothetical protein WDZ92_49120, partial [Nostoc sp. NIES-2111]
MASTVQSTASALLPEAPQRPSPARGADRRDDFAARLDEAESARDRGREPAQPVARRASPRDTDRGGPDPSSRAAARDDARADAGETDRAAEMAQDPRPAGRKPAIARPVRTERTETAREPRDGTDGAAVTARAADQPAPDAIPAVPSQDGVTPDPVQAEDTGQDTEQKAGETGKDAQDAAPPVTDPALAALVAALGDAAPAEPA